MPDGVLWKKGQHDIEVTGTGTSPGFLVLPDGYWRMRGDPRTRVCQNLRAPGCLCPRRTGHVRMARPPEDARQLARKSPRHA